MSDKGNYIDFLNLSDNETDKIRTTVKVIAEYFGERAAVNDSIKQTLEDLVDTLNPDKETASKLKKYVKSAATAYYKDVAERVRDENTEFERVLEQIDIL